MQYKILFILLWASISAAAQCPGPSQRTALLNLQRSLEVESTRAGQIPLTDTCGNQRYAQYVEVELDTIGYTPTSTGNVSNLSEFVIDPTGAIFYIDWQGNAIEFAGSSASCDVDWLQISDNSCPDAITDSIYKQRYASVGARYVWPGAEFLVNDSLTAGILVVQGSRNARTAWYDSNVGTFSMFDHGGSTPVFYMPVGANMVWKTTAGTPQTPVGSQVDHFGINAQDSTIQMFQYDNTRTDTQSVVNFLYTDPVGKIRSRPVTYIQDSLGLGENIYNSNGIIPADETRNVNLDTLSTLRFNYAISGPDQPYTAIRISSPDDSTGTNSGVTIKGGAQGNSYISITNENTDILFPEGGYFYVAGEDGDGQQYMGVYDTRLEIYMENGEGDHYSYFYMDTVGTALIQAQTTLADVSTVGFDPSVGSGLFVYINDFYPTEGQILVADTDQTFKFADPSEVATNIYNSNGNIGIGTERVLVIDSLSTLSFYYSPVSGTDIAAINIDGGDRSGTSGYVAAYSPDGVNQMYIDNSECYLTSDEYLGLGDVQATSGGYGVEINSNANTLTVGDPFDANISGLFIDFAANTTTISESVENFVKVSSDGSGVVAGWSDASQFAAGNASNTSYINQTIQSIEITGADSQGSEALYSIEGDTTGNVTLIASRNDGAAKTIALSLSNIDGDPISAYLSAYDESAAITLNEIGVDTAGAYLNTRGGTGNLNQVAQSNGSHLFWGVTIEDGQLSADQLSFGVNGWENVNANREIYSIGYGATPSITPSVGMTDIIVSDTATTSTVNLNYVPGELDGADYSGNYTTVRYIWNWGSGDCTVDTNQDWLFRTQGAGSGATTLTIPTGQGYKLIWIQGTTEANSRFWCFRIN